MAFTHDLNIIRNALLLSEVWNAPFLDATSDAGAHIFFYSFDVDVLEDGLPSVLISHSSRWSRDIQAMGGNFFLTDSGLLLHFEQKYDDSLYTDPQILEAFSDFVGGVMLDLEKLVQCYLIKTYSPESTDTPSLSAETEEDSRVSFRVLLNGV